MMHRMSLLPTLPCTALLCIIPSIQINSIHSTHSVCLSVCLPVCPNSEYETFVRLMKIMKPIAKMKKDLKSDEKQSSGGGGGEAGGKAGSKGGEWSRAE
jgi:hypothetical protein